jgi:hypothetical protein
MFQNDRQTLKNLTAIEIIVRSSPDFKNLTKNK